MRPRSNDRGILSSQTWMDSYTLRFNEAPIK